MLDPQARALIQLMIERGVPPMDTLTPVEARRFYLERRFFTQPEPPALGEVLDLCTDGGVPLRLYRPVGATPGANLQPVLVYFHGGGWTIGDLDTHDVLCRQLCAAAGCAVMSVDYRLGPEHRFYLLTTDSVAYYRGHYIAESAHWSDWRASPLLAADLSRLPPALVITAGFDPLLDEGRQYADALSAAGNRVQYVCFQRQVHGFITMSRVIDEARSAVALCGAVLREALGC